MKFQYFCWKSDKNIYRTYVKTGNLPIFESGNIENIGNPPILISGKPGNIGNPPILTSGGPGNSVPPGICKSYTHLSCITATNWILRSKPKTHRPKREEFCLLHVYCLCTGYPTANLPKSKHREKVRKNTQPFILKFINGKKVSNFSGASSPDPPNQKKRHGRPRRRRRRRKK